MSCLASLERLGRVGTAALVCMVVCGTATAAPHDLTAHKVEASKALSERFDQQQTQTHIVVFNEPSLSEYRGEIPGLPAPDRNPARGNRLDARGPASEAYVARLAAEQDRTVAEISAMLGRTIEVKRHYRHAINAVAMDLSVVEAERVARHPDVRMVEGYRQYELDTDAGPAWIGAPGLWDGSNTGGLPGTRGEGIVIGIIDSGINSDHPSFSATDSEGYTHTNPLGSGVFLGYCATNAGFCNDKLIGAYDFVFDDTVGDPDVAEEPEPEDNNNHGSHVAGTAGGNVTTAEFNGQMLPVSGVAPRANIVAYDVCYTRISDGRGVCPFTSTLSGIDQAVADGIVDVINFSISGGQEPWDESNSLAFLNAFNAGIFVSASAGNSGPGAGTLGHHEPWVTSVAAATHDRFFVDTELDVTSGGSPSNLVDLPAREGTGPALSSTLSGEIRFEDGNPEGCNSGGGFPVDFFANSIALIQRGSCSFAEKVNNALAAGALGVVVFNNRVGSPIIMGQLEATTVSSVMLTQASGEGLRDQILGAGGATTVDITPRGDNQVVGRDPIAGDIIVDFSSRGPAGDLSLVKPDVAAPGSNILAAFSNGAAPTVPEFGAISGTSMASPHNAGAAALLLSLNPTWTPAEIKSALMMTSRAEMFADNGGGIDPAGVFDRGAGRINLTVAARTGLVMDETGGNMSAADPDLGGDPSTLNLASLGDSTCGASCLFNRVVSSVGTSTTQFEASFSGDPGLIGVVTPSTFTLNNGETQNLDIDIDLTGVDAEAWYFGEVQITSTVFEDGLVFRSSFETDDPANSQGSPGVPLHMPAAFFAQSQRIEVSPTSLTSTLDADTTEDQILTISNQGIGNLDWDSTVKTIARTTVFEQPGGPTAGIVSSFYNDMAAGVYSTDDFTVSGNATVASLFVDGFVPEPDTLLAQATAIDWYIYADMAGLPAGHPEDGMANEFWSFTAAPTAPGVTLVDDSISLDLVAAGAPALNLTAGTYWLIVAPNVITTSGLSPRWNWLASSTSAGTNAQLIDPQDLFGGGFTTYTDLTVIDEVYAGLAFGVFEDKTCGAPWVSINPTSDTVTTGGATMATVTFDATGLTPGSTQDTVLCITSNDPTSPVATIPVTLNVNP